MSLAPTTIPSLVVVGKKETVVIEFKSKLASSQELITLDFLDDATKKSYTTHEQCTQLGPSTIKAHFPAFSKPGWIEVIPKIGRQSNPLFPPFKVCVASPVEEVYSLCNREQDKKAILSCILTYITHLSPEDAQTIRLQADTLICKLLSSMPEIPPWDLATFLCGGHDDDNLLHFAARYRFDGMAENLAKHIAKTNKDVLWQVSSDKKTPLEIAKKNELVRTVDTLKRLQATYGPQGKKTEKKKKKGMKHAEEDEVKKQLPESEYMSASGVSCRTSTISSSSVPESICSSVGTEKEVCILKALNDISCQYLYKAKVIQDYQVSSYQHGELSIKVGDIVYVTQEEGEECMGIADLKYVRFPKCVLQQIIEDSEHYQVPRIQPVYVDDNSSENEYAPIYDVPRSASLPRKLMDTRSRSHSCDTGLDQIETVDASTQQAAVKMSNGPKATGTQDSSTVFVNSRDAVQNLLPNYYQFRKILLQMQNSREAQPIPSTSQVTSATVHITPKVAAPPLQVESSSINAQGAPVHNQNTSAAAKNLSAGCYDARPDGEQDVLLDHGSDCIAFQTMPTPQKELLTAEVPEEMKVVRSCANLGSACESDTICIPSPTSVLQDGKESTDGGKQSPRPKPKPRSKNPNINRASTTTSQNSAEIVQRLPSKNSSLITPEPLNCVPSIIESCSSAIPSATVATSTVAHTPPQIILIDSNTTCSPLQPTFTKPTPPAVSPRVKRQPAEVAPSTNQGHKD
ncbi:hypothetical protein EMCRGX_G028016 [Ephydatia muelleri]